MNSKRNKVLKFRDPNLLLNLCKDIIKDIIDDNTIAFEYHHNLGNREIYLLAGGKNGSRIMVNDLKSEDWAVPIVITKNGNIYWLGISISFSYQNQFYEIFQISLKVYEGIFTSEIKNLVFRAEWGTLGENNLHAQPHWHFHGWTSLQKIQITEERWTEEKILTFEEDGSGANHTLDELKYFHFAMSSSWHDSEICQMEFEDEKRVKNWLKSCLKYVMQQFEYLT